MELEDSLYHVVVLHFLVWFILWRRTVHQTSIGPEHEVRESDLVAARLAEDHFTVVEDLNTVAPVLVQFIDIFTISVQAAIHCSHSCILR